MIEPSTVVAINARAARIGWDIAVKFEKVGSSMIIMLLVFLNLQLAFFLFNKKITDDARDYENKINNDRNFERIINIIEKLDLNLNHFRSVYENHSDLSRNANIEIVRNTGKLNYIYNLLLLIEEEDHEKEQSKELGLDNLMDEIEINRIEIEKVMSIMMGRWEMRKGQIER